MDVEQLAKRSIRGNVGACDLDLGGPRRSCERRIAMSTGAAEGFGICNAPVLIPMSLPPKDGGTDS